ncbi:MAG: radical SAM protein [Clostridiales bacterium]|nr:MAG: radical SAM protein [Clostridiales bacterium]
MASKITSVDKGSPAFRAGISAGETLVKINGNEIHDVLDYRFYSADPVLDLELLSADGAARTVRIVNRSYRPLGLEFETYLMDKQARCHNKCVFCFIDQLPGGMRDSLYFKDDDMRMSFLMGNYVTLTNLTAEDFAKIKRMRISPINISVHATDPEVRRKMCGNRFAGDCYKIMHDLAASGITMNAQIVVCPGLNDGKVLERSLDDLILLYPYVQSISVVPVGLTKHRQGLYPLEPVTRQGAREILDLCNQRAAAALRRHGSRVVFAADELYIKAGRPLPSYEEYEDFAQLENGVGMLASLIAEFDEALADTADKPCAPQAFSIATGTAAAPFLRELAEKFMRSCPGSRCGVYAVENRFFGEQITVAGLITGRDLIDALRGRPLGGRLLIAQSMLRYDQAVFLDDVTPADVEAALNVRLVAVPNDGAALLRAMRGEL